MAIVSRLGVVLGLDSAEFNKGLGLAESKLGSFSNSTIGSKLGVAALGAALVSVAVSAFEFADKINDISLSTEISVGKVLAFSQALSLNGVNSEAATKMLSSFSVKVDEAATHSQKGRDNFAKLGISLKDISTMDTATLMEKTLKGLAGIEDPITRSAVAFELLGKASKGLDLKGAYDDFMAQKDKNKGVDKAFADTGDAFDNLDKLMTRIKTNMVTNTGGIFKAITEGAIQAFDKVESLYQKFIQLNAQYDKRTGDIFKVKDVQKELGLTPTQLPQKVIAAMVSSKVPTSEVVRPIGKTDEQIAASKKLADEMQKQSDELNKQVKSYEQQTVASGRTLTEVEKLTLEFEKTGKFDTIKAGSDKERLINAAKELDIAHELVKSREAELKYGNEKKAIVNATNDIAIGNERLALEASLVNELSNVKIQKLAEFDITQKILKMQQDMNVAVLNTEQGQRIVNDAKSAEADAMKNHAILIAAEKAKALQIEIDAVNVSAERYNLEASIAGESDTQVQKALQLFDLQQKMIDLQKNGATNDQIIAYHDAAIAAIDAQEADVRAQNTYQAGWSKAYNNTLEAAKDSATLGAQAFSSMADSMSSALDTFVNTGKISFSDLAGSIIKDLIKIQLKAQASSLFSGLLGSMGGIFGGGGGIGADVSFDTYNAMPRLGFANGGDPPVNQASMVGERGPELFIPKSAGTIIPNNVLNGANSNNQPQVVYNGTVIQNMSAIDTQSGIQFLSKNKNTIFAVNQSAQRSLPQSR